MNSIIRHKAEYYTLLGHDAVFICNDLQTYRVPCCLHVISGHRGKTFSGTEVTIYAQTLRHISEEFRRYQQSCKTVKSHT